MKFVHISDTHVLKDYTKDQATASLQGMQGLVNPKKNMEKLCKRVNWEDVDFAIFTGDLVHEGEKADYVYFRKLAEKNIPNTVKIFYALGNHDPKEAFYRAFFNMDSCEPYYYTDEIKGYRIIVLDTAIARKESGTVTAEQLDWLRNILKNPSPKGSIIFTHHPLFWNSATGATMVCTNGAEVLEILENSDTFAIFCGHTHMNAAQTRGKLTQYTADSLAFSLEVPDKEYLAVNDRIGYSIIDVENQNITAHFERCYKAKHEIRIPLNSFMQQLKKLDEQEES